MKSNPVVSFIMPVYNCEAYLEKSIASVLRQTLSELELVCVDNASTDSSLGILKARAGEDDRIVVVEESRQGVSAARNAGLAHARGDYIAFIDADDFISPDYAERLVEQARRFDAEMTICGFDEYLSADEYCHPREMCEARELYSRAFSLEDAPCLSSEITTPNVWRILFKRGFVEKAHLHFEDDLRTAEDLAFIYRALFVAQRITLVDARLYHYRRDVATSLTRSNREGDGLRALGHIGCYLELVGMDDARKRHFVNLVLDTVRYGLESAASSNEALRLFDEYHEIWHGFIRENEALIDARYRPFFEKVDECNAYEYLFDLYSRLRDEAERYDARLSRLKGELEKARAETKAARHELEACSSERDDLLGSWAFRIGKAITFIPSKIKAKLKAHN